LNVFIDPNAFTCLSFAAAAAHTHTNTHTRLGYLYTVSFYLSIVLFSAHLLQSWAQ